MEIQRLLFTLGRDEKNMEAEAAFQLASPRRRLLFSHDIDGRDAKWIFLRVYDPAGRLRFQKQLSFSSPVICLGQGPMETTMGGIPGELPAGEWRLCFAAYPDNARSMAERGGITFSVTVSDAGAMPAEPIGENLWADINFDYTGYDFHKIYRRGKGWYMGDFHTHTQLSDGEELPSRAMEKARFMHMDFYTPTEHNAVHTGWPATDLLILPGVEATSPLGHANLFGLDRIPDGLDRLVTAREKDGAEVAEVMEGLVRQCKERGWLFSINHPYLYTWKWLYGDMALSNVNCLEIINDPTYAADPEAQAEEANRKAVCLADCLWADGYRICAIGGSDSHRRIDEPYPGAGEPSIPGDPATWLHMGSLSPEHLLKVLKDCRCYVTRHCRVESEIRALDSDGRLLREVTFGDILSRDTRKVSASLTFSGLSAEPKVFAVFNGKRLELPVGREDGKYTVQTVISLVQTPYEWLRFGAETAEGDFLFYGNPLTKGKKKHQFHYFRDTEGYIDHNEY